MNLIKNLPGPLLVFFGAVSLSFGAHRSEKEKDSKFSR
tara:strand:- start:88 stop:201 length:114 start_codon:yes stop_codon:yes gene_type:complete